MIVTGISPDGGTGFEPRDTGFSGQFCLEFRMPPLRSSGNVASVCLEKFHGQRQQGRGLTLHEPGVCLNLLVGCAVSVPVWIAFENGARRWGSRVLALFGYPPWLVMWGIATAMFFACKLISLTGVRAPWWRKWLYVVAWPGMNAAAFCSGSLRDPTLVQRANRRGSLRDPTLVRGANHDIGRSSALPSWSELLFSLAKIGFGCSLLFGLAPMIDLPLLRGWVGMVGIIFTLHFGLFHVLSWCWRRVGVDAKPLMVWPILATSLSDFWGRRWNTAFRDLTHRFLFRPLTGRLGAKGGLAVGFLFSGIVHDVVISVPAGGGYGLPTLYFLLQGAGLLVERAIPGIRGRWFTLAVLVLPAYWLFHPPFVLEVIVPFLDWLQAPTLVLRNT
ncbi:MAG: hypothetical protein JNK57_04275 [Planctomycetaceae bacterium]|nr:hypothetical protein [Planctomycetaceae bacterium]